MSTSTFETIPYGTVYVPVHTLCPQICQQCLVVERVQAKSYNRQSVFELEAMLFFSPHHQLIYNNNIIQQQRMLLQVRGRSKTRNRITCIEDVSSSIYLSFGTYTGSNGNPNKSYSASNLLSSISKLSACNFITILM